MNQKIRIFSTIIFVTVSLFIFFGFYGNDTVKINNIKVENNKIPNNFNGYKIAHISDLHNAEFGANNELIIKKLKMNQPDIIVITGDLVDSNHTDVDICMDLVKESVNIAPTYFVTGNHEFKISDPEGFIEKLEQNGALVLRDRRVQIEKSGEVISLIGVDDPSFKRNYYFDQNDIADGYDLKQLRSNENEFTILLSHRAELFDIYVAGEMDLVLSGHAHGGQIRLPVIGGLFAPEQGWFPKYQSGIYRKNDTDMVVSRGLGNSIFPYRFYNTPEIVMVELKNDSKN